MMPLLGHPAGLWALLGIPAVVAIHFLQQRSRVVRTSTWFLIEKLAPDSARGRTWERLRTSRAFWLQLAAVILATWLLIEPRWVRAESAQTVVVVLDDSASMSAFRARAIEAANREMAADAGFAARTTWVVMTTNARQPPLYRGYSRDDASAALATWDPSLGQHDLAPAVHIGRGLAGATGRCVLITDQRGKVPAGQRAIGVGRPLDNVGFAGASVARDNGGLVWRALVKNDSGTPQHRTWHVEVAGQASPEQTLDLPAEGLTEISASWPTDAAELTVSLSNDAFAADDRLPLVRPVPKPLLVSIDGSGAAADFFRKAARAVDGITVLTQNAAATLRIAELDSFQADAETRGGIFWPPADKRPQIPLMTDPLVPEHDGLVLGLNWQAWIGTGPGGYVMDPTDVPLVWQYRWPLIFLRPATTPHDHVPAHGRKLMLAFDWATCNADRLPAMVLLAERYLARERDAQPAPYSANFDCGARVPLADSIPAGPLAIEFSQPGVPAVETRPISTRERAELRAPERVGTFSIRRGKELLVHGATQFADPREGDFRAASTFTIDLPGEQRIALERNTEGDPLTPVWLLLLGAALLGSWWTRSSAPKGETSREAALPGGKVA